MEVVLGVQAVHRLRSMCVPRERLQRLGRSVRAHLDYLPQVVPRDGFRHGSRVCQLAALLGLEQRVEEVAVGVEVGHDHWDIEEDLHLPALGAHRFATRRATQHAAHAGQVLVMHLHLEQALNLQDRAHSLRKRRLWDARRCVFPLGQAQTERTARELHRGSGQPRRRGPHPAQGGHPRRAWVSRA